MIYDIAIIGAGASGLMTASHNQDKRVCLIDKNPKIGAKIKVSGGSKCNITNKYLSSKKYDGDEQFINEVFKKFDNNDLLKFLNDNGVYPKLNEKIVDGTYFCDSSQDVIDMFERLTKKSKFYLNSEVLDVEYKDGIYEIELLKLPLQNKSCPTMDTQNQDFTHRDKLSLSNSPKSSFIQARKLIVASGGLSYPSLGATDIGFKIAKKFGHTIITPNPALVGFTVQKEQFWFKELSGLSIDEVKITIGDKKVKGSMLFTHKGCSGPAILSASLYWKKGHISIDFLPSKKSYLPKRFKKAFLSNNIEKNLRNYIFSPAGNFGYSKAEVTKGGISTDEIDINTMESKLKNNIFFIGEIVDVSGELGGYNFQWAFSSAKKLLS